MEHFALGLLLKHRDADKLALLADLGVRLRTHFESHGELDILQRSIARLEMANRLTPTGHPEKPAWLLDLGISLRTRFSHLGQLDDLELAHAFHRFAVFLTPEGHLSMPIRLAELGETLRARFRRLDDLNDIQSAVAMQSRALDHATEGYPERPKLLSALAGSLTARFRRLEDPDDLERALTAHRQAIDLTPDGHSARPARLTSFAISLGERFDRLGELNDLEQAIHAKQLALDLTPEGHLEKPDRLVNLAISFRERFRRLGALNDLERALDLKRLALRLTPDGHPEKPNRLVNLAMSLCERFRRLNESNDLEHAINAEQLALELTPEGHPEKPGRLTNLAVFVAERFQHFGELDDLEQAIKAEQHALALTPEGHPERPTRLSNLAVSLQLRFKRLGELEDLERAATLHQRAVELTPDGHPAKSSRLTNLVASLHDRFKRHGQVTHLERAIDVAELALVLTPDEHPDKHMRLFNLSLMVQERYNLRGELEDLERAINAQRLALELTPDGHPHKPDLLSHLAISLVLRFKRHDELYDIERAINYHRRAVELTFDGHPSKILRLYNLGLALCHRYNRHGELQDLEQAIDAEELAINLTPDDHPLKAAKLCYLAVSLMTRHRIHGDADDLGRAISVGQLALDLTPDGHPEMSDRHATLATLLSDRYHYQGQLEDLERSNFFHRQAVKHTPEGHFDKARRLYNLGLSFQDLFQALPSKSRFDAAVDCLMEAAMQSLSNPTARLDSAQQCLSLLSEHPDFGSAESLLHAHSHIIQILPEIAWLGHSVDRRFKESAKLGSLMNDATSAVLKSRSRYQAIEWMESGRSLVWSQISSLRTPLDENLTKEHPDLASSLNEVLGELRRLSHSLSHRPQRSDGIPHPVHLNNTTLDFPGIPTAADSHQELVVRYESLLKKIRSHEGFANFMRSPGIKSLLPLIEHLDGPVVFINVHASACDALALLPNGAIKHVPLPDFTESRARNLRSAWMRCLHSSDRRVRAVVTHDSRVLRGGTTMFGLVLGRLWTWIVQPILEALEFIDNTSSDRLPHITWCPTGPLTQLPLHAAGIYDITQTDRPRIFDFVVSSYTPSLAALLRSRESLSTHSSSSDVLVVAQPATPGLSPLPGTHDECARIQKLLPASNFLKHEQATMTDTLSVISHSPCLHLACHGVQDKSNPTQSAFALYDGRLTLSMLMDTMSDNAELAFLSACETAVGDEKIPEESAHLAAGMLAVGFKGVIATMWSIGDADAPIIVEAYYRKLLELRSSDDMAPGYTGAAYALHDAVKVLRDRVGEQDFVKWAPFVHFGV
ncbi:hypothetical protein PENSPDRAFT_474000 [Peniophora sp. CONT]|nr:hypothetical protein PENSPDRAFT_474000 [Peniophora sp. CONT]